MLKNNKLLDIDLHLFDGAAGAAPAAAEGGEQGEASTPKAETKVQRGSSRRAKSGAYDNVVFGKQPETDTPAAGESMDEGESNTVDMKKSFDELISGEYKDAFAEKTQSIINRRFKETKGMEESLAAQKPIMDILMQRYKVTDGDIAKLRTAMENDNTYYEEAAEEAGMSVDQYKAFQTLERENAEYKLKNERREAEQQAQQQLAKWYSEGEKLKELYPGFDFKAETENPEFRKLLKSGIDVKHAYEVIHMDDIKNATAKAAAQAASQQVVANVKNKASRPLENGTSSQGAAIIKNDVHNLSRADRKEIARRAQRGETIRF